MVKKSKEEKVEEEKEESTTRDDRENMVINHLTNMESEQEDRPTNMAKSIGIHKNTLTPILDKKETFQIAGNFEFTRNPQNKEIVRIKKLKDIRDELDWRNELRGYVINLNKRLDTLTDSMIRLSKKQKINTINE